MTVIDSESQLIIALLITIEECTSDCTTIAVNHTSMYDMCLYIQNYSFPRDIGQEVNISSTMDALCGILAALASGGYNLSWRPRV